MSTCKPIPPFMSTDSDVRKQMPVATGCMAYFPDALMCVSFISKVGNEKHNPGQPLHWAKEKSTDEPDAEVRHMLDHLRGLPPDPGLEPLGELGHLASKAWRALAHLQRACDAVRAAHAAPAPVERDPFPSIKVEPAPAPWTPKVGDVVIVNSKYSDNRRGKIEGVDSTSGDSLPFYVRFLDGGAAASEWCELGELRLLATFDEQHPAT